MRNSVAQHKDSTLPYVEHIGDQIHQVWSNPLLTSL
jgi:hypothetical protein